MAAAVQATPFQVLGTGNGFHKCVEKVDVSVYQHWTTFSGFNKTTGGVPTAQSIGESRQAAINMYWNLHRVTVDTDNVAFQTTEIIVNGEYTDEFTTPTPEPVKPKDRNCRGNLWSFHQVDYSQNGSINLDLNQYFTEPAGIVRMYDGDITDETLFRGYGSGVVDDAYNEYAPIETFTNDGIAADVYASLGGFGNETVVSYWTSKYEYIVLNGIHFLFVGLAGKPEPSWSAIVTGGTTLKAEVRDADGNFWMKAQITGLEFYPYP